jgi:hypothetical protein
MAGACDSDSVEEVQLMAEWTDERMDDLAANMAAGFDRTDRAIGELRGEISTLRTEMRADHAALNAMMFRFCLAAILLMGGFATALVGVFAVGPS